MGTGVGGGIIMDGKMLTGAKGAAGEIGHIHVDHAFMHDALCIHRSGNTDSDSYNVGLVNGFLGNFLFHCRRGCSKSRG